MSGETHQTLRQTGLSVTSGGGSLQSGSAIQQPQALNVNYPGLQILNSDHGIHVQGLWPLIGELAYLSLVDTRTVNAAT